MWWKAGSQIGGCSHTAAHITSNHQQKNLIQSTTISTAATEHRFDFLSSTFVHHFAKWKVSI